MTKLALINYLLQILFIRIYRSKENGKTIGFGLLYFVVPFTGWINPYIVVGKKLQFTKLLVKL